MRGLKKTERGALAKDDRLDALAMAVAYWTESMDRDATKAQEDHRAALLDEELRRFHDSVFMTEKTELNWMNR